MKIGRRHITEEQSQAIADLASIVVQALSRIFNDWRVVAVCVTAIAVTFLNNTSPERKEEFRKAIIKAVEQACR